MARRVPGTLPTAIVSAALGIVLAASAVWAAGPWSGGQRVSERHAPGSSAPKATPKAARGPEPELPPGAQHVPAVPALVPVLAGDKALAYLTPTGLAAALTPLAVLPGLGKHVGIAVADPAAPTLLYDDKASEAFAPASTNKVVTAVAALAALGPDRRFATRVLAVPGGSGTTQIVLVGGGDPTLSTTSAAPDAAWSPASLDDLAAHTAAALTAQGVKSVTVGYDATLFGGPALHPTWSAGYTDGNVAPVVGLMADEGRAKPTDELSPRVNDPAAQAAAEFATRLAAHGVAVTGKPSAATGYSGLVTNPAAGASANGQAPVGAATPGAQSQSPAVGGASASGAATQAAGGANGQTVVGSATTGAAGSGPGQTAPVATSGSPAPGQPAAPTELARVESPRLADLVEHMLTVSDNDLAEALIRQVAIVDDKPATFEGGTSAVRDILGAHLGLNLAGLSVVDGSGLSRSDRLTPALLVRVLTVAAATDHPDLRAALTGLPVAGFTGTLAENNRFASPQSSSAAGLVRAKTGSLTGVATLAGIVRDSAGQLLVFAFMADQAPDASAARAALDRLAATLSGCGCGAVPAPASQSAGSGA